MDSDFYVDSEIWYAFSADIFLVFNLHYNVFCVNLKKNLKNNAFLKG